MCRHAVSRGVPVWVLAFALALGACTREPRYVVTEAKQLQALHKAWSERDKFPPLDPLDYRAPLYAKYLKGLKICLDPGHGGDAAQKGYKRGPTEYREAIVNWKVANYLKEFLEGSGAQVKLTRAGDVEVGLAERVRIANEWRADLFISLHHNAIDNPSVNRTTTWFHMDPDFEPANCDLARYIQQGVADALQLPQIDGVPLKSDQLMYKTGFGVLRGLNMVACLCEASFFTHPYEEYRMKQESYVKREAYGYFLGLARYAWMGIPKATLTNPNPGSVIENKRPKIEMRANNGLSDRGNWGGDRPWIFSDSAVVTIDGKKVASSFDKTSGTITAVLQEPLAPGDHVVRGGFRSYAGNYSHPVKFTFTVDPPVEFLNVEFVPRPPEAPADQPTTITLTALDADGDPVRDGTELRLTSDGATFSSDVVKTKGGRAAAVIASVKVPGDKPLAIRVEGKFGSIPIILQKPHGAPFLWRE